jgi:teichuronic acid biosynthesis glycosyltransferase TuaC
MQPVRTLLFSTLYPSSVRPGHGIFVETRLRELVRGGGVQPVVMAPVPWFPSRHPRFGGYARLAATPAREVWNGIEVLHPRYPLLPKVGMTLAPVLLAAACLRPIQRLIESGLDFDVIDAHYYYPDGVAAAWLARHFHKPVTITARGSDLTQIGNYPLPRRMMTWAAGHAAASIGVCQALVDVLSDWGVEPERLHVMRNGVDLRRFTFESRDALRRGLNLSNGPLLLSVGHLIERKGHDLVIQVLAGLLPDYPGAQLVIIGEGPERERLEACAAAAGVTDSVRFTGALPQQELVRWYGASDLMVLASSREGWANVLLEAMACGTPVVATRAGGTPEVLTAPDVGRVVDQRSVPALRAAVAAMLAAPPPRERVRAHAEAFAWDPTSAQQLQLFRHLARSADA